MTTAQDLCIEALGLIGVADPGDGPSSSELDTAFRGLNHLLASWSAQGVGIPQIKRESFALTGAVNYTIGTGATFDTTRPLAVKAAAVVSSGVSQALEILTAEQWAAIKDKTRSGKFARAMFFDGGYPQATISLWPTPGVGSSIELYSFKPLAEFANLSTAVDLPPGYERALEFALAADLAPKFSAPISEGLAAGAAEAKGAIFALNAQVLSGAAAQPAPAE